MNNPYKIIYKVKINNEYQHYIYIYVGNVENHIKDILEKIKDNKWEAYVDSGREKTGLDIIDWSQKVQELGVGEILLTSVDKDGTESGLDKELINEVSKKTNVSLIVSGGIGKPEDYKTCVKNIKVDGIAAGSIFHYNKFTISDIKKYLLDNKNVNIRTIKATSSKKTNTQNEYDINNYNKYSFNSIPQYSIGFNL